MTTIQELAALRDAINATIPEVRKQYATLAQGRLLMQRLDVPSIVDAYHEEARQRVLRRMRAGESLANN